MVGCTLPRVSAVRALSEGREGQLQVSSSGCLAAQIQRLTESNRLPGPLAGVFSPARTEADSWAPRQCMTDVGSLALSSPAETCVWEGLGIAEFHTSKGSSTKSSVDGKGRATAELLQLLLGCPDSAPH